MGEGNPGRQHEGRVTWGIFHKSRSANRGHCCPRGGGHARLRHELPGCRSGRALPRARHPARQGRGARPDPAAAVATGHDFFMGLAFLPSWRAPCRDPSSPAEADDLPRQPAFPSERRRFGPPALRAGPLATSRLRSFRCWRHIACTQSRPRTSPSSCERSQPSRSAERTVRRP